MNSNPFNCQSIQTGKMQTYELGQFLRKRYDGFIPKKFHADHIFVRSSDMDRTIMSADTVLSGLYPPINKWNDRIDWQPIPVHSVPLEQDNVRTSRFFIIFHSS